MSKIQKAPGANTNTFTTEVKGMSIYPKTLKGQHINASVMFTSDDHSETLSVFDTTTKKQIILPYKGIERLIDHVRQQRK